MAVAFKQAAEILSIEFLNNVQVSVFITLERFYQGPDMSRVAGKEIFHRVVKSPGLLH